MPDLRAASACFGDGSMPSTLIVLEEVTQHIAVVARWLDHQTVRPEPAAFYELEGIGARMSSRSCENEEKYKIVGAEELLRRWRGKNLDQRAHWTERELKDNAAPFPTWPRKEPVRFRHRPEVEHGLKADLTTRVALA